MRFLLRPRWILFAVLVALMAWVTSQLGQWQFHRLEDRRAANQLLHDNRTADPVPIDDLMSPDHGPADDVEWRRVDVTGHWDDTATVVVKYRPRGGQSGVSVVTPLLTDAGTAILVERGWMAAPNSQTKPETPAPTSGEVTVTGHVRADATGKSTVVDSGQTRAVSSTAIGEALPYPHYRGFLSFQAQQPAADDGLLPPELPDETSEGPHFFYGLQWWFFGGLAIVGFGFLIYDEWRREQRRRAESETPEHAAVNGEHDAGDE